MALILQWDSSEIAFLKTRDGFPGALKRALTKAGNRALRDMKAASQKSVRFRKKLPVAKVNDALKIVFPRGKNDIASLEWRMDVSRKLVPLVQYPYRLTRSGVSVKVNAAGGFKPIKNAFVAQMRSGHIGIFRRVGKKRLPIVEAKYSTTVSDVFKDNGMIPAVYKRTAKTFDRDFKRLLPLELLRR